VIGFITPFLGFAYIDESILFGFNAEYVFIANGGKTVNRKSGYIFKYI